MKLLQPFVLVSLAIASGCGGGGSGGGGSGGGGGSIAASGDASIFGITTNNRLVSLNPGAPNTLLSSRPVSGLATGETLVAIDNRPGTGELFALGSTNRVYAIDPATAAATQVGSSPFTPTLTGTDFGFDFNPVVDRIRVVSDANQNLRISPFTGVVLATDAPVEFDAADANTGLDPEIVASAFTNDFFGATSTTLFAIDAGLDALVRQGSSGGAPVSANSGKLFTVGPLGVDTSNEAGLDISVSGAAFACLTAPGTTSSELYAVNLGTGFAALLGTIGGGNVIRDIAVVPPQAPRAFAITTANRLVSFHPATPSLLLGSVTVTGLQPNENVVGLDFRPATGALIGLGGTSRVYEINTTTGVATEIGAGQFAPSLLGTDFGVDFNPVPDRLRIVSDSEQNMRLNPSTGAIAATDTALSFEGADQNTGADPTVVASAYTGNFAGSKSTTLYGIDAGLDVLLRQGSLGGIPQSPNAGVLSTVGSLGVNASMLVGFDVSTFGGAVASITAPGASDSQLYAINLDTGVAGLIGTIGGLAAVRDIAMELPAAPRLYGVTSSNKLVSFLAGEPEELLGTVAVSGMQAGESVLAIDFRPATHELVALGSANRLYKIDRSTGAATQIGVGAFGLGLAGAEYGFDFNPSVDRIRILSDLDQNLRVHPVTGVILGVDGNLGYAASDVNSGANPSIVAAAYSSNFAGSTSTTLYAIDTALDVLVTLGSPAGAPISPNSGTLFTVGGLNLDASQVVGFDISTQGGAFAAITAPAAGVSQFYSISLATGQATLVGTIGGTETIRGLAAVPAGL
jgi:3D (Asp-Asp-Asp) domain-containing protein